MKKTSRAGSAVMVDISEKEIARRVAVASGTVKVSPRTMRMIKDNRVPKGDVLVVARIAGIQAAKRTSQLIPLCHPLQLTSVTVDARVAGARRIEVVSEVVNVGRTGPDMEALVSVSTACLTIYDMIKSLDREATVERIYLRSKSGGRSGTYTRR